MSVNKFAVAKAAINLIAGAGVSKVTNDIIRNNTTVETTADSVLVWAGSVVIGMIAADAGSKTVNAKMDEIAGHINRTSTDTPPTSE